MTENDRVFDAFRNCISEPKCKDCPWTECDKLKNRRVDIPIDLALAVMRMLKAQEPATVEPKRIDLADETKAWLDKMDAVDALGNIANICMDWDGYRTANGLGGLVNEIWAYAKYCADRLLKAHEPRVMTLEEVKALPDESDIWLEEFCAIVVAVTVSHQTDIYKVLKRYNQNATYFYGIERADYNSGEYMDDDYGKEWRCWTSRPTDEQREAIPWE